MYKTVCLTLDSYVRRLISHGPSKTLSVVLKHVPSSHPCHVMSRERSGEAHALYHAPIISESYSVARNAITDDIPS